MTTVGVFVLRLLDAAFALEPIEATRVACRIERYDDCAEVVRIARVESRGRRVSVHTGHHPRRPGSVFWRAAVAAGWLRPDECDAHQADDGGFGWGIRGPHGLAAAYSVRHLGDCVAAEVVDVPLLSAIITIRRLVELRQRYKLNREQRALAWRVGVGAVLRDRLDIDLDGSTLSVR